MRKSQKSLNELAALLRTMRDEGELEPGQGKHAFQAVEKLKHALRVGKRQHIEAAANQLARVFLRDVLR